MTENTPKEPKKPPEAKAKKPAAKAKQQKPDEASVKQWRGSVSATENPAPDQHRQQLQRWAEPRFAGEKAAYLKELQAAYGNRHVQRLHDSQAAPTPDGAAGQSTGRPLENPVRQDMEQRFGASFDGVKIHTDTAAANAAKGFGARAFTTGRDVYFARGNYQPSATGGKKLLAHELAHTLQQQGQAGPMRQDALQIVPADDPSEAQAERAANEAVRDGRLSANTVSSLAGQAGRPLAGARMMQREAGPEADRTAPIPPGPKPPAQEETAKTGDFTIALGGGFTIHKEELEADGNKARFEKDLSSVALPGIKPKGLVIDLKNGEVAGGHLTADLNIPYLRSPGGDSARIDIAKDGKVSFKAKAKVEIPALNEPVIDVSMKDGEFSAEATLAADKLKPPGMPKLKIPQATVTVGIAQNRLYGSGQVVLEYAGLAKGDFSIGFKEGEPTGKGRVELTPEYLQGAAVDLQIANGSLQGEATIPASKLAPPVPGLTLSAGTLTLGLTDSALSGAGDGIEFDYRGLGKGSVSFSIAKDRLQGKGSLDLSIPGLSPVSGALAYQDGQLSGMATITPDKFPKGLPIKGGAITVSVDEKGEIGGRGNLAVNLFGAGGGSLTFGYEKGILDLSAAVELRNIPGLEAGQVRIGLKDGTLEGEGEIAIAAKMIPGLSGNLLVIYKDDRFSGKAKPTYAKDKLSGQADILLNQDEKGKLTISGSGELTARLADWLTGQVHIEILPDATTKIAGTLKADDIELFPEKKTDRELFNVSKNIPLWAILVAVIRLRGGVRAGVGPGRLRGVTAEGQFSTEEGKEPSFDIHGELYIPAYAESYLAFGAGLGLDVLVGSLTGGIEGIGTAGAYGAVSVIPEIAYQGGNYSISGTATLAAGAKLKLGLQAWAEVEAMLTTVWSNEWKLGEWVWDAGPELALQAEMNYVLGHPEPPTIDFKTTDIDAERLIQDAMPKDGPKGSGAREALQNKAEWKGKLKEKGKDAGKLPPELAQKQQKAPETPAAPPKPTKKAKAKPGEVTPKAGIKEEGGKKTPEMEKTIKETVKKEHDSKNVRELAAAKLSTRLGDGKPLEEVNKIVAEVLKDLRPVGLERLEVSDPNELGERSILAAASSLEELLALAPVLADRKEVSVAMATKIELNGEKPVQDDAQRLSGFLPHPRVGDRGVSQPKDIPKNQNRPEMAVLAPTAMEPFTLDAVSWNTNVNLNRQNMVTRNSHAETQFEVWLSGESKSFKSRIKNINILLSHSPCDACCEQLKGLLQDLKRDRSKEIEKNLNKDVSKKKEQVIGSIKWHSLFPGTTAKGINDLKEGGWEGEYGLLPAGATLKDPTDDDLAEPVKAVPPIHRKKQPEKKPVKAVLPTRRK